MAIHQPTADVDFADQEILAASRAGDKIALEILYRWYAHRLLKFCQNRLQNSAEAEDAAHETILKAYAALPTFRNGAKLWPWLATIASNVCTDIQRRRKYFDPAEFTEPPGQDFQEAVDARARAEIVNVALTELPSRYQTLVYLKDFTGLSYEQIAQKLDTSVATVRSRLLRGRSMLRLLIRRVAKQRGHWPLPVLVPVDSWVKTPSTLWRRAQALRSELAYWWLRVADLFDFSAVWSLANVVAIVAWLVVAPLNAPTDSYPSEKRQQVTSKLGASEDQATQGSVGLSVRFGRTKDRDKQVIKATTPNAVVEVDQNEETSSWADLGPIRISCDRDPNRGTVSAIVLDVACPALQE